MKLPTFAVLVLTSLTTAAPPPVATPIDHRDGVVDRLVSLPGVELTADATVLVLRDANCPMCKRYGPTLAALEDEFAGVPFVFVNVEPTNSAEDRKSDAARFDGAYIHDDDRSLARALEARSTTEAFVIDGSGTVRYRGAVDDQYGIGEALPAPRHTFLRAAIEDVRAGRPVALKATAAPGCALPQFPPVNPIDAPTWHERVSRVVQANCQACHHAGGIGPFPLETYEQVKSRSAMVHYVLRENIMPPWFAEGESRAMRNDMSLSNDDRQAVMDWIEAGCPEGDRAQTPAPISHEPGWQIGEPDAIVRTKPVRVKASGTMDYIYLYVQTDFEGDRWIQAMEFRPKHPEVVHHALAFIEAPQQPGESRRDVGRRWQGGLRGYFAGLVPGQASTVYPDGMAKKLPAKSWLKFQIHYTPNGTALEDVVELGFVFADGPPLREMKTSSAQEDDFVIPAGAANHPVSATYRFREPATVFSFAPHMHLRGKAFRYELIHPDGTEEVVLDIPRYDFDWQLRYKLLEPIEVPAGARLRATGWFDNSSGNPSNPDPKRDVPFGEQTWDEMMVGYFEWSRGGES